METVPEFLFSQAEQAPDRTAITAWHERDWINLTWLELASKVAQAAEDLVAAGIVPGDRVVLHAANSWQWVVADLAIQVAGAVCVPLSHLLTRSQADQLIGHSGARMVLAGPEIPPVRNPVAAVTFRSLVEWAGQPHVECSGEQVNSGLAMVRGRSSPDYLFSIIYTSGTTGEPKGVMLTQSNVVSNAMAKVQAIPLFADDRRLCWLPMAHVFSRVADIATGLLAGCHLVISRGRDHLFGELARFQPSYLNGVPWFFERCLGELDSRGSRHEPGSLARLLGGNMRLCNCGGAPLPGHVAEWFDRQKVPLICGYGLTEASPVVTGSDWSDYRRGSVGRPLPGVEVRIAGDGEVLVRGPNVMRGYYRDPAETSRAIVDGWLGTGDLGRLDDDGFLFLTGRKKELIVTATGRNIAPGPIESQLLADPLIRQCLIVGDGLPFLVAVLVLEDGIPAGVPRGVGGDMEKAAVLTGSARLWWAERLAMRLDGRPPWECPAGIVLARNPFTVENGLATPKQSLRREEISRWLETEIRAAAEIARAERRPGP